MMKLRLGWWMVVGCMGIALWQVGMPEAGAGSWVLNGRVTDAETGEPIAGAALLVEPLAMMPAEGVRFPAGPPAFLETNAEGYYLTLDPTDLIHKVQVAPAIPPKHAYVRILVAKLDGPPNYEVAERLIRLADVPASSGNYLTEHFALPRLRKGPPPPHLAAGTFVRGSVRDSATGEGLADFPVEAWTGAPGLVRELFRTDAEGNFFGIVPTVEQPVAFSVPSPQDRITPIPARNGLRYAPAGVSRYVTAGATVNVDIGLEPTATQMSVIGRVTNMSNGQPIPYALVEAILIQGGKTTHAYGMTNQLGRYQVALVPGDASAGPITSIRVRTNGAFLKYATAKAPYQGQKVDLTTRLKDGDIYQQDFALLPKQ